MQQGNHRVVALRLSRSKAERGGVCPKRLDVTNNAANVVVYGYDRAGQLTNEISFTNGLAGFVTNSWQYDEAGNWLNSPGAGTRWVYNADNELMARTASSDSTWTTTVTGEVQPGDGSNKWYNTTAQCRGVIGRVSTNNGTFSLPGVGLYPGANELQVTVTDVSGNTSQQTRTVTRSTSSCLEIFGYDGNGNLTNWVNGSQNWAYEWDWADRLTKVSSNGVVMLENWYDASSRRIARNERIGGSMVGYLSLYDGWDIVALVNTSGAIHESYTRGVAIAGDIGGLVSVTRHPFNTQYYVHNNHRGDVIHVRSGTTTTTTYRYSAFGQLVETTGANYCRFKFSSKELSASCGLYYYGYRFYAPRWQRWINKDPTGEGGGFNTYAFVLNAPLGVIDVVGLDGTNAGVQLYSVPSSGNTATYNVGTFDRGVNCWGVAQPFGLPWSTNVGSHTAAWPAVISYPLPPCPPLKREPCSKTNAPGTSAPPQTNSPPPPPVPPVLSPPTVSPTR